MVAGGKIHLLLEWFSTISFARPHPAVAIPPWLWGGEYVLHRDNMFMSEQLPSLQVILQQRQQQEFVGREEQITLFRKNLFFKPEDGRRETSPRMVYKSRQ